MVTAGQTKGAQLAQAAKEKTTDSNQQRKQT